MDTDGHQELGGWLGEMGSFLSRDGALSPVRLAARSEGSRAQTEREVMEVRGEVGYSESEGYAGEET